MHSRTVTTTYFKQDTVTYRAELTTVQELRIAVQDHQLPPGTPFLYQFFPDPATTIVRYGWEDDTIVFYLDTPYTGTLVLTATISTLLPHHP